MKLGRAMAAAAARLGHDFARPELLLEALTHPSTASGTHNQRLEFLGDRVLGLVIAEALLAQDPAAEEGQLAPRLNALVRRETCAEVAAELDLGAAMRLGRSEMLTGGRRKTALLGDAMEAVIAAVYLDAGLEAARALVLRHWGQRIAAAQRGRARREDHAAGMGAGARAAAARLPRPRARGAGPCAGLLRPGAARRRPRRARAVEARAAARREACSPARDAMARLDRRWRRAPRPGAAPTPRRVGRPTRRLPGASRVNRAARRASLASLDAIRA